MVVMFGYPSIHGKSQKDKGFTAELLRFPALSTNLVYKTEKRRQGMHLSMVWGKYKYRSITALENPHAEHSFPEKRDFYWKSPFLSMFRGAPEIDVDIQNYHMGVSENRGTSKSSILIGISIINHPF